MEVESIMFDFKDYYDKIANLLPENCTVCEVGVANGASALFLANQLRTKSKPFKMYMVDNMDYGGMNQLNTIWRNVHNSGLADFIEIIPKDSVTASHDFNGDSLDFLFLDSSHEFLPTRKEIYNWYSKLKDGCIMAGHDYFSVENPGVKKAVDLMLPETIQRPPIVETNQSFPEHQFLHTYQTERENGIWEITKVFYWQPTLKK